VWSRVVAVTIECFDRLALGKFSLRGEVLPFDASQHHQARRCHFFKANRKAAAAVPNVCT
jgi:hypothetical protein